MVKKNFDCETMKLLFIFAIEIKKTKQQRETRQKGLPNVFPLNKMLANRITEIKLTIEKKKRKKERGQRTASPLVLA